MIDLKTTRHATTIIKHTVGLDGKSILAMLCAELGIEIPVGATITFAVPGGGDYSNMDLDVDADSPVIVQWSTEVED